LALTRLGHKCLRKIALGRAEPVSRLIYTMITSLDGYVADESGDFGWAEPDASVHAFINDLERSVGTYLLGRRMYEVMAWWETIDDSSDIPPHIADFARLWRAADKVVYSSTLSDVSTARTQLERDFDAAAVERMKAESERDISVGGPTLASAAIAAGLIDEYQLFVAPVIVGGGLRAFFRGATRHLELLEECRFDSGFVYLDYARRDAQVPSARRTARDEERVP
jgi:dihydrofolate reductase